MVPVNVDQLFLSNMGFIVLLKGLHDERTLPIFIGATEAQAIAIQINGVKIPRPLTHDLLKNVLDYLECRLMRIEVCDLKEGTFFAKLIFERDGIEMDMDSRPSDAIALALRVTAPIYVADKVMDEAGRVFDKSEIDANKGEGGKTEKGKKQTPIEALQAELEKAIEDERYEDAAKLRDKIKDIESSLSGN